MSDLTFINKDLVMEGTLQAKDSQVVIAGKYKGSIEAKTVILEASNSIDTFVSSASNAYFYIKINVEIILSSFFLNKNVAAYFNV